MILPELIMLKDFDASYYLDEVYSVFLTDIVHGNLSFLDLPITCPYHPPYDNKHFSFWHMISENSPSKLEQDRVPDIKRCERVRWIKYALENADDKQNIWCWEKTISTSRGVNKHVVLYIHEEGFLIVLKRKKNRFDLVTAYVKNNHLYMVKEKQNYPDPRK